MANPDHIRILHYDAERWNELVASKYGQGTLLDMRSVSLPGADLSDRDFRNVDLQGAQFQGAFVNRANFAGARLRGANLSRASLKDAFFLTADLTAADLAGAHLHRAKVLHCDLSGAQFTAAQMWQAVLLSSRVAKTNWRDAEAYETVWAGLDLTLAVGLDEMRHLGPSTIGLDTVLASAGRIPDVFLRGSGVPDEVITYVRSLALSGSTVQLYSCFISYSSKDQDFCERLRNDLQAAGVRCWFAPDALKIGDRFRDEIGSAIRVHDKLLLVLSISSVNSSWVQSEVESAMERERQGAHVLFPIRLDDAVLETEKTWAADIRLHRHIGDFSGWKDHDRYKRAFQRLLRDLRTASG